jgi:EmrB/QacA subfamily drug resistance transporter
MHASDLEVDTRTIRPGTAEFRLLFTGLVTTLFLSALDTSIVGTAMPTIVGELGGFAWFTWATTSYMVASTVASLILGKLSDLYGRRNVYLLTIIGFLIASVLCGLSQNMGQLIGFRILQGFTGGGIWSLTFAIVGDVVTPRERGKYFGLFTSVFTVASVAGPLGGGLIVDNFSWRWIFFVNLPIGAVAIALVVKTLKLPRRKGEVSLDIWGAVLIAAALTALMVGLKRGDGAGFGDQWTVTMLASAVFLGVAFVWWEGRAVEPLLPLRLFTNKPVSRALQLSFVVGMAMMTPWTFFALYFQNSRLLSPSAAGLRTLAIMVGILLGSTLTGRLISKTGHYRRFPLFGIPIAIGGMALGSLMQSQAHDWVLVLAMLCIGFGSGLTMPTMSIAVQNSAETRDLGIATSTGNFVRNLGSAVGLAVFGTIFNAFVRTELSDRLPASSSRTDVLSVIETPKKLAALPDEVRSVVTDVIANGTGKVLLFTLGVTLIGLFLATRLVEAPLRTTTSAQPSE